MQPLIYNTLKLLKKQVPDN